MLTVGKGATGSVLELFEARVRLEGLAERLCTLWTNEVSEETANKSRMAASGGVLTVGNILACDGVLEGREGHILLEALSEILGTFSTNIVACEPANKGRHVVSTRADSREGSNWQRTRA